jgi:hypothetical protein
MLNKFFYLQFQMETGSKAFFGKKIIKKAVDEFFQDKSERPVFMPDNGGSALIRKV